jgi:hypothetical protein
VFLQIENTNMKLAISFSMLLVFLVTYGKDQQNPTEHPKVLLLNAGNSAWPVKLTKQWFEGDTIYMLTFRNARFKSFKIANQGFFKFEFKEFGNALQTALFIDTSSSVKFSEGIIKIIPGKTRNNKVRCHFPTGIFLANESDIKMIISAIRKEK